MKNAVFIVVLVSIDAFGPPTFAQDHARRAGFPYSNRLTLGGGVSQLLLGGFNGQAEYTTKRLVFDYSHGFNINLSGQAASLTVQRQQLNEKLVSTLGIGIGYRITPGLDIRVEPKLHFYEADIKQAESLLTDSETRAGVADRGYDANSLINWLADSKIEVVIPAKKNRLAERPIDENLHKDRNKVERYFNKLKQYRWVTTRYEKTAVSFAGFIYLASALILVA